MVEIGSLVLEKKNFFLNFNIVFSLFCNYLLFEKGVALHLNNLEIPILKLPMNSSRFSSTELKESISDHLSFVRLSVRL